MAKQHCHDRSDDSKPRSREPLLAGGAAPNPLAPSEQSAVQGIHGGLSLTSELGGHITSGVILFESPKQLVALNDRARHFLGLDPNNAASPAFDALPAPLQAFVLETLTSGKAPADRQFELTTRTVGKITLHTSAVPFQRGGSGSGVVVALSDLTSACQLEGRLAQLDRLANLGTLAAGMAHEIKNALVAGKTFVDLLLEKNQDVELVEVVRREMSRIDTIVNRMLKFAGSARPSFGQVHLHEILEHSLRLVQHQLEDKLVSLNRSFQADPDLVQGDDHQLQQAFVNLFLNALEAMGTNGILSVATETIPPGDKTARHGDSPNEAQVSVAIRDNGVGIQPENMPRLFEPFFTTKQNGTGLGLLITRRIILEHRGTISVESQPGRGTAFQIILPASA